MKPILLIVAVITALLGIPSALWNTLQIVDRARGKHPGEDLAPDPNDHADKT